MQCAVWKHLEFSASVHTAATATAVERGGKHAANIVSSTDRRRLGMLCAMLRALKACRCANKFTSNCHVLCAALRFYLHSNRRHSAACRRSRAAAIVRVCQCVAECDLAGGLGVVKVSTLSTHTHRAALVALAHVA